MSTREELLRKIISTVCHSPLKRLSIDVGTGVGKTFIALSHMSYHMHECSSYLVVVNRKTLIKNWKKEIVELGFGNLADSIEFVTYRSLHKIEKEYDWIYLDELQFFKSNLHYATIQNSDSCVLAMTGTYFEENTYDYERFTKEFPIVYVYKTRSAVKEELLNDYRILIHKIPLSKTIRVASYKKEYMTEVQAYLTWDSTIKKLEKNNAHYSFLEMPRLFRMKVLQGCMSKVMYAKELLKVSTKKTLVFAESTKHADLICSNRIHSKISKIKAEKTMEDFCNGTIQQLSSVGQLNEGISVPDLETIIILHSYGNNKTAAQRIARGLRLGVESGRTAYVHILVYENTIDEEWCKNALKDFDKSKIGYFNSEKLNLFLKKANLINE